MRFGSTTSDKAQGIGGTSSYSIGASAVDVLCASLPVAWLQSSLAIICGSGTYNDPYVLTGGICNSLPNPTGENSVANVGAFASYVSGYSSLILSGTANDADSGQTLTVQYQLDSTAGTWNNLATLTANASNQSWSGTVTLPAGLSAGTHTIYVSIYDGYAYSNSKTMSFIMDMDAPITTATLVGGVKCTGDATIYCTAPTGVKLSDSIDSQAGIGAYRTVWDTNFTALSSTPAWISGAPSTDLATTNHTTPGRTHTLYYQTRDKVGNTSPVGSSAYYVNATPQLTLQNPSHDVTITPYTPLILSGTFTDQDTSQSATISIIINGVDYQSQAYQTLGGEMAWSLVVNADAIKNVPADKLTNLPVTVRDSAGSSSTTYYTGQITVSDHPNSQIYLSVIRDIPFSLTLGKLGAFNISFGTYNGITTSTNANGEIIVSGQLGADTQVTFGVTTLVFTTLDAPSIDTQEVDFV
jgi:hypothetical protein